MRVLWNDLVAPARLGMALELGGELGETYLRVIHGLYKSAPKPYGSAAKIKIGAWICPWCDLPPRKHVDHECMACGNPPGPRPIHSRHALVLDHCHETGRPRGYICQSCNVRLGRLESGRAKPEHHPELVAYLVYQ